MKKLIFVVLIACVAFIGCEAKEAEARGGDPCKSFLGSILNDCVGHPTEKEKMEVGVGLDIPLIKTAGLIIDQETKLDLNAGENWEINKADLATYTVFKPQLEEGILQTAWNKIKSLFGR